MDKISRRQFIARAAAAGVTSAAIGYGVPGLACAADQTVGTVIDLTRCRGCGRCSEACQVSHGLEVDRTPGLSPGRWLDIQSVEVEQQGQAIRVFIPRRCMHCDNPPCAKVCPIGINVKKPAGPVVIDTNYCLGGQKCKNVCPWQIPQLKKGVGFYKKLEPLPFGAGIMFKCDLCYDRIKNGGIPACVEACPNEALSFGTKEAMRELAHQKAQAINGYVYGESENGGTSTYYVSTIPFEELHQGLVKQGSRPGMPIEAENFLDTSNGMIRSMLVAPIAGAFAAGLTAYKTLKGEE